MSREVNEVRESRKRQTQGGRKEPVEVVRGASSLLRQCSRARTRKSSDGVSGVPSSDLHRSSSLPSSAIAFVFLQLRFLFWLTGHTGS